jgi:hypothetical protein
LKNSYWSIGLLVMATQAPSFAAPVIGAASFSVERREPNTASVFATTMGESALWNLSITTAGPCTGVSVVVSRAGDTSFNLDLNPDPIFAGCNFSRVSDPFSSAASLISFVGQTNPWSYTATDSTGSISGLFPVNNDPEALPFAQNIQVSDSSTTPTVTWDLPVLTDFDVDNVELRLIDAANGLQLFRASLAPTASSYTFAPGLLQEGRAYYYRVMLIDRENRLPENRSSAFSTNATAVPEPSTLSLIGLALLGLARVGKRRAADLA